LMARSLAVPKILVRTLSKTTEFLRFPVECDGNRARRAGQPAENRSSQQPG
jgi:hypothetical protein